jgi:hypothetical protein
MYRSLIAEAGLGARFDAHTVRPTCADRARFLLDPICDGHRSRADMLRSTGRTEEPAFHLPCDHRFDVERASALSPRLTTSILRFSLNLD